MYLQADSVSLYVAYPSTAQNAIDQAHLVVTSQSISQPAPDRFYLDQLAVFVTDNDDSATLDPWRARLCLDLECPHPFAQVDVPKSQAYNGSHIEISDYAQVVNMTEFNKYTRLALGCEEYIFYLKGKGVLHNGAWPVTMVDYNKNITLQGLNALQNISLTAFNITYPIPATGPNANGTILLPNPSISAFELGSITFNMSVDDTSIGSALLQNVNIVPGDNFAPMNATLEFAAIAALLHGSYQSGRLPVDLVGSSVIYDGTHIPWYEQALAALPLRLNLQIPPGL